jgi:hypothetical protein
MLTKEIFCLFTNTDLTEGRGAQVPLALCEVEQTAKRLAKGKYIMGSDAPCSKVKMIEVAGVWYVPASAVTIHKPTKEDAALQSKIDDFREALQKAKDAGLSEEDIKLLAAGI